MTVAELWNREPFVLIMAAIGTIQSSKWTIIIIFKILEYLENPGYK